MLRRHKKTRFFEHVHAKNPDDIRLGESSSIPGGASLIATGSRVQANRHMPINAESSYDPLR
jgi:hypothetical protein